MSSAGVEEHLRGLSAFLLPARRDRFADAMLASRRVREKELRRLAHRPYVDSSFVRSRPRPEAAIATITKLSRAKGWDTSLYVVSDDAELDGYLGGALDVAERAIYSDATSLISFVPGEVALFAGEFVDDLAVLGR